MRLSYAPPIPLALALAMVSCSDDDSDLAPDGQVAADTSVASDTGTADGGVADGITQAMSFFVTSVGLGNGGDLGGIAGADAHCQMLATAAGSTKTWVAYLSAENAGGTPVNARDRIGSGPWFNAKGSMLAADLTALHPTIDPALDRDGYIAVKPADAVLFWDEKGEQVPNVEHDILTGSTAQGMVLVGRTCQDWTSSSDDNPESTGNHAQVGHTDTPSSTTFSPSWNSAHESLGCSQDPGVSARLGSGRFYCFATD